MYYDDENLPVWRKATKSNPSGNCVQVAFRAATASQMSNCVQVGYDGQAGTILVRNSKNPDGGVLEFTPSEWDAFCDGMSKGEFSLRRLAS